jgi:hypothetical protein
LKRKLQLCTPTLLPKMQRLEDSEHINR